MARWMYTDAIERVACPKCGQEKGNACRTPKGKRALTPHGERVETLHALPDFDIKNYQVRSYTVKEAINRLFDKRY